MTVVRHYVNKRGLPRALYVDRDSIFRVNRAANREESLAGTPAQSQFGRAMRDLDVELIWCAFAASEGPWSDVTGRFRIGW